MKWSFEEDFIVCNFYLSHIDTWQNCIDEVMTELKNAGFGSRDENSVKMRIQNYKYLHTGTGLSNVAKQTKRIYTVFEQRMKNPAFAKELQDFIKNTFEPIGTTLTGTSQESSSFVPIEPVGPSFQKVLFDFIDASGMKDSEVYNSCFVGSL